MTQAPSLEMMIQGEAALRALQCDLTTARLSSSTLEAI